MTRYLACGLLAAALLAPLVLQGAEKAEKTEKPPEGFTPLFNGTDLTGWKVHGGKMEAWGVDKGGILYVQGGGGGWLLTEKEYGDFELRLEYKMPPAGNSGVAVRAPRMGDPAYQGMEIQLLDDDAPVYAKLRPAQYTGSIYDVVPPSKRVTKPAGEWNAIHITAKGRKVTVELNGTVTVDADLDDHKESFTKHPGLLRKTGCTGFQSHDGRVEFRNIFIKEL